MIKTLEEACVMCIVYINGHKYTALYFLMKN